MKIAVVGTGYVGLSNAVLLAQKYQVKAVDIIPEKVDKINNKISPIVDAEIEKFLATESLDLEATTNLEYAVSNAKFVFIATPTDYDPKTNYFNTSSVDSVLKAVTKLNPNATVVIKSTIPVGYTAAKISEGYTNVVFIPEFLREGKALYDNLYPSRIVIGEDSDRAQILGKMLTECAHKKDIPILYTHSTEAEAIKLFSNTYLATRVAFFNELDTFAESKNLDPKSIIDGISSDSRIGNYYNNPSFGYGGYCLPKDTKQLKSNYNNIPENLISAIINSNETRKKYICESILKYNPSVIGIYRLTMKKDSTNFRESAILDIIKEINKENKKVRIIIYEPLLHINSFNGFEIVNDFNVFQEQSDIIVANRVDEKLKNNKKVYTRDIYNIN